MAAVTPAPTVDNDGIVVTMKSFPKNKGEKRGLRIRMRYVRDHLLRWVDDTESGTPSCNIVAVTDKPKGVMCTGRRPMPRAILFKNLTTGEIKTQKPKGIRSQMLPSSLMN